MSNTVAGVRGAGVNRSGATDTTMLIWKVIDANPGITREEIFAKVEHEIPAGWAKRRYIQAGKIAGNRAESPAILTRARRYILTESLASIRRTRRIEGSPEGGYETLRPIRFYGGDGERIDATGDQAANHLNERYAWRTLHAARKRWKTDSPRLSRAEYRALVALLDAEARR